MADVYTPNPPALPADCAVAPPSARSPSPSWLADYLGPKPSTPAPSQGVSINGIDGLWWPPQMQLEYIGQYLKIDEAEVDAGRGFEIQIPADEIWRLNFVAVDYVTNANTAARLFVINFYDLTDGFNMYLAGQNDPGANTGGTVIFIPGEWGPKVKTQYLTETLPQRFYLRPNWSVNIQMVTAGTDFVSHVRWNLEKWTVRPIQGGGGGGGGGGAATGGGYQWPGPIFQEG